MRQTIYIEYDPEIQLEMPSISGKPAPIKIFSEFNNPPELIRWRKRAIDESIRSAVDLLNTKGGPQDIVIGDMYVLKNVERINQVYPVGSMPGFLCIEFEQAIYV